MEPYAVWAPDASNVELLLGGARTGGRRDADGWWRTAQQPMAGQDYGWLVDGEGPFPDPRSAWQPNGVHELSRCYDHDAFGWTDAAWRGRALPGAVTYELHIGTFTPAGTFDAAIERLDHLVELGVDLVEVMPVAAFPGVHGWGYDGVALFAVHQPYGGPNGFKRFVDACHARGLGVLLDVVHNHLGPSGNYLPRFGPYFTDSHHTPWGSAVNLDDAGSDEVRRYLIDNACGWLRDFHLDGLRMDAVHALHDTRAVHYLAELSEAVDALATAVGRPLALIAESDRNDPLTVTPRAAGGLGLTASWDDDVHHALHALLSGERQGYYVDFGSLDCLGHVLTSVFWHDGRYSPFRGRGHGAPVDRVHTPGHRYVVALQNHDQVGNRAVGDRLSASVSQGRLRIGAALLLTGPFSPLLFMGEEWAADTPWQYFTDHTEPELAAAVRDGRRQEFAGHGWSAEQVPDPQDPATVAASRLDWAEPAKEPHAGMLAWYRALLTLRRKRPELTDPRLDRVAVSFDADAKWFVLHRGGLRVVVNLAEHPQIVPPAGTVRAVLLTSSEPQPEASAAGLRLAAESVAIVEVD
ncbi:MAG TPA: malto-oligosyltrehalose trehalohydrolase [Sporichthyaceae bacterium]